MIEYKRCGSNGSRDGVYSFAGCSARKRGIYFDLKDWIVLTIIQSL